MRRATEVALGQPVVIPALTRVRPWPKVVRLGLWVSMERPVLRQGALPLAALALLHGMAVQAVRERPAPGVMVAVVAVAAVLLVQLRWVVVAQRALLEAQAVRVVLVVLPPVELPVRVLWMLPQTTPVVTAMFGVIHLMPLSRVQAVAVVVVLVITAHLGAVAAPPVIMEQVVAVAVVAVLVQLPAELAVVVSKVSSW